jgi:hypothetical protein
MTFDDDFCRIHFAAGSRNVACIKMKMEWPPPEIIDFGWGFRFERTSYSKITDEQRKTMTHVARGAEYRSVSSYPATKNDKKDEKSPF